MDYRNTKFRTFGRRLQFDKPLPLNGKHNKSIENCELGMCIKLTWKTVKWLAAGVFVRLDDAEGCAGGRKRIMRFRQRGRVRSHFTVGRTASSETRPLIPHTVSVRPISLYHQDVRPHGSEDVTWTGTVRYFARIKHVIVIGGGLRIIGVAYCMDIDIRPTVCVWSKVMARSSRFSCTGFLTKFLHALQSLGASTLRLITLK